MVLGKPDSDLGGGGGSQDPVPANICMARKCSIVGLNAAYAVQSRGRFFQTFHHQTGNLRADAK
jgi:hypothetical protein